MKGPFFSVIIPCYNTKPDNIKILLTSILDQEDISKSEIEVIISDDCSTDKEYLKIVDAFRPYLSINLVKTDENAIHCPGNNRENGVRHANGQWITFIDHDDLFTADCFKSVKDAIESSGEQYMASAFFAEVDPVCYTHILQRFEYRLSWLHGKFYNLENFWKARNIHFIKDLYTHEDMAISTQVECELNKLGRPSPLHVEMIGYLWRAMPDSLSRQDGYGFLNQHMDDYIYSTGGLYLKDYKERGNNSVVDFYFKYCVDVILHAYFYMQYFVFVDRNGDHENNFNICSDFIKDVCDTFGKSLDDIYDASAENNAFLYNRSRNEACVAIGNMIEQQSFKNFLERRNIC